MEVERDDWFNRVRPMVPLGKTWKEKRIAREEARGSSSSGDEGSENVEGATVVDVNMVFQLQLSFVCQSQMPRNLHWVLKGPCLRNQRCSENT
jgi:hypothetical protein